MPAFDHNPFRLLGIAPATRHSEAVEAKDDAVFDGRLDTMAADDAVHQLSDPRLRLQAELSWPLDSGDLADPELPDRLSGQPSVNVKPGSPLTRLILLSHKVKSDRADTLAAKIVEFTRLFQDLHSESIIQLVNDARKQAGIPLATADQVAEELDRRRSDIARDILAALGEPEAAGPVLADAVQQSLVRSEPGPFLFDLVRRHDVNSDSALTALENEFEGIERAVRADPAAAPTHLAAIRSALQRWDRINQPVQLLEQHGGHEEGRSLAIGRQLRNLAVQMTNEHDQPLFSNAVVDSLLETFPELEGLAAQLRSDKQALAPFAAAAKRSQLPHRDAVRRTPPPRVPTSKSTSSGIKPRWWWGFALPVLLAFLDLVEESPRSSASSPPPRQTEISPDAQNWETYPNSASSTAAPAAAAPTLHEVLPAPGTRNLLGANEILYCLSQSKRLTIAQADIPDSAVSAFNALVDDFNMRCTSYRYHESDAAAARQAMNESALHRGAIEILASLKGSGAATAPTLYEVRPAPGTQSLLSANEILYCLSQSKRLTIAQADIPDSSVSAFNTLVDDFNTRCASYRYDESDAAAAQQAMNESDLHRGAMEILASLEASGVADSIPDPTAPTGDPLTDALRDAGASAAPPMPDPTDLRVPAIARATQARLSDLGFLRPNEVDGQFGRGSAKALQRFKASRGLPSNDVWDYATQQELFR